MNILRAYDARPGKTIASRPVLARLIVLLLGMMGTLAALEFGLAVSGSIYRWRYEQRAVPSDGKTVILCLGDSFTYGSGAPPGQSYPDQLGALLNPGAERKYRVVNAGRIGANSTIAKGIFLERVDKIKPQIVTLMIGSANYWNYTGYHRAGQSRLMRVLMDAWRRIRVIKLARLLFLQLSQKSQPGFQVEDGSQTSPGRIPSGQVSRAADSPHLTEPPGPVSVSMGPDGFWSDWSKGLVRCRGAAKRGREVRPDLAAEVVALLKLQQFKEAQKRVQESIRSRPADGRVHALMGFIHWVSHDLAQASASFENARRLDPQDGYVQLGMVAVAIGSAPDYKAFEPISRIISAAPEDALLSRVAGYLLEDNNDYVGSVAMFEKSLRLDPCQSLGFVVLGDAYKRIGRRDEAQAMQREALRLDPSNLAAKFAFLRSMGRYEEVFRFCRSQSPDDSERIQTCRDAPESLIRDGAPGEIVLRLARYLAGLRPRDPLMLYVMGKVELGSGRTREAEALFSRAAELAPSDARLAFDIAQAYLLTKAPQKAREWALRGRRLDPNAPDFPLLLLHTYGHGPDSLSSVDAIAKRNWAEEIRAHMRKGHPLEYWNELRNLPLESVLAAPLRLLEGAWNLSDLESWLRDDVQSIADECRRRGIRLVIMNYPRRTGFLGYKDSAASVGALFVDVQKDFDPLRADGSEARYFAPDRHCNAAGYGIIARTLSQEMRMAGLLP